jgi:hypothetical protein
MPIGKKNKDKKKVQPKQKKRLVPKTGSFDPAHPASTILMARKQTRDMKRKPNGR